MILYDAEGRDGVRTLHGRRVTPSGRVELVDAPAHQRLGRSVWGVERRTRADHGASARVRDTLEDSPFYARSVLDTRLGGHRVAAVHETLDLARFSQSWVQFLLPFKTRRG